MGNSHLIDLVSETSHYQVRKKQIPFHSSLLSDEDVTKFY